jgi:uncharacterized membrane protein
MKKEEDYIVGILAYLTVVGFIIALVLNNDKTGEQKSFGSFHLRQALGLHLGSFVLYLGYAIISTLLFAIGSLFGFIANLLFIVMVLVILAFVVIGVLGALEGKQKPLPFIGEYIQSIMKNTFD